MQNPPPAPAAKSSTGLDENIAALLAYIAGWVSGLIFFLIEKDSKLVRFHAMQSLLLSGAAIVVGIALWVIILVLALILGQISSALGGIVSILGGLILFVFFICVFIGAVLGMIRAYQNQYFKLPILGNFAEKFANK